MFRAGGSMAKLGPIIAAVVAVALALGAWMLMATGTSSRLDASALGVDGLALLAPDLGLTIEGPQRISPRKASEYSLAILPLYDLSLSSQDEAPRNLVEQLGQTTLREMDAGVFDDKVSALKTLVVLPKWRGGVMVTGLANEVFLIPPQDFTPLMADLVLYRSKLEHGPAAFAEAEVTVGGGRAKLALFHPQTFDRKLLPGHCKEVLGIYQGALVISCTPTIYQSAIAFLSDPDLLNNHGLTLAENAKVVALVVKALQKPGEARPIYLDTATEFLLAPEDDEEGQYYERDTDTLLRFFDWPLSLFWLAGAAVFGVALWRGAVRFGPAQRKSEGRLEISKLAAIDAKARLIRMSQNDPRMVAEFVQDRLHRLAEQIYGTGLGDTATARLHAKFARQNPQAAADLKMQAERLMDTSRPLSPPDLRRALSEFQDLLQRLTHGPV